MALGRNISPGQGEKYYRKDDYYLVRGGGEDHKLEWGGKLAAELGLSGKASEEDWKNALHGRFPGGIEIQGGSFRDPDTGERERRAGTDFEFSAPKSVSIQALVFGDERLIEIHRRAVSKAIAFLEEQTGARRGHAGKDWETTGQALIGRVTHMTSREGDPHLHDHGVFLNVTKNSDGKYQAATNDRQLHYQRLAQEVYHSELSRGLEEAGYELEKGQYEEPQIKGYTREQLAHFSGRGAQIEAYIREKWGLEWKALSRKERNEKRWMKEEAWEMTRKSKKVGELEGLQDRWLEEARAIGAGEILPGKAASRLGPEERLDQARDALAFAVAHLTERESAVPEGELIRTALQAGRCKITMEDMKKAVTEAIASEDLVRQADGLAGRKQNLVTSREALEREKRILKFERAGRNAVEPVLNPIQAEMTLKAIQEREGLTLNAEQKAAARMILTTGNRYVGINGYAGVGKTTMLKPAVEALQNGAAISALKGAGFEVIGLGPQHSAVHALRDAGIIEGRTLQSWLADRKAGEALTGKTVVVIDEAGLANSKDLESAMKRIEKAGARAVLVGDIKQYESVAAGPAFRQLQDKGMETVYVTEMQRQRKAPENVREAARLSVDSPEKALEKLEIREIRNAKERYKALSEEYLKSSDRKETLVLTGTHEARKAVNENVREALNIKGKGEEFRRFEAGDFTEAQKKRIDFYEVGQNIRFGKDYRSMGVRSGEVGKVATVDRENGTVRLEMGDRRSVILTPRELSGKGHEIGKIETIELAPGDRIRITGNELKKEGITNGMKGEVLATNHGSLSVRLDNGRTFEMRGGGRPLEIDHGYAQTGHSAQGLGAETVILDLPSGSRTLSRRSFYTNLTRTKGKVVAFTDDRERLTGAVMRENDKTMALDVEERSRGKTRRREKSSGLEKENIVTGYEKGREESMAVPEPTKRELERQKSMEEGSPERKTMEQGKEEKKEVLKDQARSREKDPFQNRPEERPERRQEREREERKEAPRIERQRDRGGMGY